ncbi:MAG: hypothetical protein ACYC7E_02220 [Armatimonadota bacterium]
MFGSVWRRRWFGWRVMLCGLLLAAGVPLAAQSDKVTLQFRTPMTAMINARAWDDTHHQWHKGKPDERYFDAIHRFLLIRFPGCAEQIHAKLLDGYTVESAQLALTWQKQEWERVEGYADRQWSLVREKVEPLHWHGRISALRRPWIDDPAIGPTWNAYINGTGYWKLGGARGAGTDRITQPLGTVGLWKEHPTGQVDITRMLNAEEFGKTLPERLRTLDACGFIVQKDELSNPEFGYAGSTGAARIWVEKPELTVVLRATGKAQNPGALPPAIDVRALARQLAQAGGDGTPSTSVPENLEALVKQMMNARRAQMPDWMWARVEEVKRIHQGPAYDPWFERMVYALDSGDKKKYVEAVLDILSRPPGWSQGHQRIEFSLPLYLYGSLLPEVVHYHLRQDYLAALPQPLEPYKLWAITSMGTLNHMGNARSTWLLGAQLTDQTGIVEAAHYGLSLLHRYMIYDAGFTSEHGDSYYRGITMAPLQAAAKFAEDPLIRLQASLMVEKLLFEDIATYHPGLRRRVSRISRRGEGLPQFVLKQDVPEAAMHTLSKDGVLIHRDVAGEQPKVHGIPVFDMSNTPPARVALMAPWGREWESNNIDKKPLPFRSVMSGNIFGWLKEHVHVMTYMGRNYAVGTEELPTYSMVPAYAAWRREARPVEGLEDFGIMLLQGRLNEQPMSEMDKTPFGILQHDNKLIWVIKIHERKFVTEGHSNLPKGVKDGLTSFKAQVTLVAYGPENMREVYVNGRRVTVFPATARQGDRITIKDGISYIGLIPLLATDMGRKLEVRLRNEHPFLILESYVMAREQPVLSADDAAWAKLVDATGGWTVEFGDASEYKTFAAFQQKIDRARIETRWERDKRVLHVSYASGKDTLEMGFRTDWARNLDLWHDQQGPSQVFAYQRVNGKYPWPDPSIVLDNPLGQMGTAGMLKKGGASLTTLKGQMAFLRVDPISGTYEGINPFIEPTPFELRTPEGAIVRAEGALGMARVTVRPKERTLWVDYALLPSEGNHGIAKFLLERPQYFRPGFDLSTSRDQSATALLVRGLGNAPKVILNGETLRGAFTSVKAEGVVYTRIPIVK